MAAQLVLYECAEQFLADGTFRLYEDTFRLMLVAPSYTPDAIAHSIKANITGEVADGGGYTAGGFLLPSFSIVRVADLTTVDMLDFETVASGSAIPAHRYLVCYAVVTRNTVVNPLVFFVLGDITGVDVPETPNGYPFGVHWNPQGIWSS